MNWAVSSMIMLALSALLFIPPTSAEPVLETIESNTDCPAVLNYRFKRLGHEEYQSVCEAYRGKLILVVNTASKCAFTPQYDGLEQLYRQYRSAGLVVLGFPSNDFAGQEPGTEKEILNFCRLTYSVEFPMFEKVHAAQGKAHPFYRHLANLADGQYPSWNFHKYLIAPDGEVIANFSSFTKPLDPRLVNTIKANLPNG
ncbi:MULTISPECIES: glutathione peroxidase [unclassified Neptuniibacter]|uniref:glutathione peroxidase n=1 Tax=unclassified Neptuniibacter TaxID=2630693 RepID=UPI000C599D8B|nr:MULTISPECIES: glutathione peroxidase [unclassified Neptuniibacter]MAY42360.1 glutathione peroxidase [Oceanospirillaceae bacterium]